MNKCLILTVFLSVVSLALGIHKYPKSEHIEPDGPCGDPLYLTPYIENNQLSKGRALSKVPSMMGHVNSYAGLFTVNKEYNSNIFFWFFPAEKNSEIAPIVLWLQGGPGATSFYGLFQENGAYRITKQQTLAKRNIYWSQKLNVIYIDNPVGVGFSFTQNDAGYATNEEQVGENLYLALVQFFELFPMYQKNDFILSGESYAGKYIPAVAWTIHQNNPTASLKINLQGLAIGDGWVDPENMFQYADYLYEHGLVDDVDKATIHKLESQIVANIKKKNWGKAYDLLDKFYLSDNSLFENVTGFTNQYNYLYTVETSDDGDLWRFMGKHKLRRSIHVGNITFDGGDIAADKLQYDIVKSVKPWFEALLDSYRVMVYNGQLDIIVAYPLTINYVQKLKWSGAEQYKRAPRKKWYVNGVLAGYTRTVKGFTEVLVRDAGHLVPSDQPQFALDLITRFARNEPF